MDTLAKTISNIRDETLNIHFGAALAELKDKIKCEPLRTTFYIYSGCVSKEVTAEIAHRFAAGNNCIATCHSTGLLTSTFYLKVKIALPDHLVHVKDGELVSSSSDESS